MTTARPPASGFRAPVVWRAALLVALGCSAPAPVAGTAGSPPETVDYQLDLDLARGMWPGAGAVARIEDLLSVTVTISGEQIVAPTHLFAEPVRIIPYHDLDGVTDGAGEPVARGDQELARLYPPGSLGIAVRHHRPGYRVLRSDDPPARLRDEFTLRDSHVELLVGVVRDGQPGVITLNSPQTYQRGRFGSADYPMVFLALELPEFLDPETRGAMVDNIRTLLLVFDAVLQFPIDYTTGDALAAHDPERVREHAVMAVRAIAGDQAARQWWVRPEHRLYCSELAFLTLSAGVLMPLNRTTFEPLVGADTWRSFVLEVERHQRGEPSNLTRWNANPFAALVPARLADEGLRPVLAYAPPGTQVPALALQPMTMADIVEHFLRTFLPRERLGERLAGAQAELLSSARVGVLVAMGLERRAKDDPELRAVLDLYARIHAVVAAQHASYAAFRAALEQPLAQARLLSIRDHETGRGLYAPPSLFHLVAQGRWPAGLVRLRYLGHGFHYSLVRRGKEDDR